MTMIPPLAYAYLQASIAMQSESRPAAVPPQPSVCVLCRKEPGTVALRFTDAHVCVECSLDVPIELHRIQGETG